MKVRKPFTLCWSIARRYFPSLINEWKADLVQECHRISLEYRGESLKDFSRFAQRELYAMSTAYGYHRPRGSKGITPRQFWDIWKLSEEIDRPKSWKRRSDFIKSFSDQATIEYENFYERILSC